MLSKGDLKFRLHGQKLHGDFVLAKMRSRRPGSKGTEWLLIKKRDDQAVSDFDVDQYDYSVLTNRTLKEIGGDEGSAEWQSNRAAASGQSRGKSAWLAEAIAKHDKQIRAENTNSRPAKNKPKQSSSPATAPRIKKKSTSLEAASSKKKAHSRLIRSRA